MVMKHMNLILLGMPGSGKGTQAEMLRKKYDLYFLSTGDLSREWASKDDRISKFVNSGKLIPEKEMTDYILRHLEKVKPDGENILFEGWPRFITQYQDLDKWLSDREREIDHIIFINIGEDAVVKRLSSRRICDKCKRIYNLITDPPPLENRCECGGRLVQRKDDNPESIKIRFQYYRDNTKKLVDYLSQARGFIEIDGERPIDVIFNDIVSRIENAKK